MTSALNKIFFKIYFYFIKKEISLVKPDKSDFKLIQDLFIKGVNNKIYGQNLISNKLKFEYTIKSMVSGNFSNDMYGRRILTLICTYGNERIGFICLAINLQEKSVEIWYFSILEKYQNYGIGKQIIKTIIDEFFETHILYARCNSNSKQMINILKLNNFKENGQNKEGYKAFYLY